MIIYIDNLKSCVIDEYPDYAITESGEVYSLRYKKYLKLKLARGYKRVSLSMDSKPKSFYIHRLLAQAFIENPLNKPQVDHIDRNPLNNDLSNLRWVTAGENLLNRAPFKTKSTRVRKVVCCKHCGNPVK